MLGMTANIYELHVQIRTGDKPRKGVITRMERKAIFDAKKEAAKFLTMDDNEEEYREWMKRHFKRAGVLLKIGDIWEIRRKVIG